MDQPISAIVDPASTPTPPPTTSAGAPWWKHHKRLIAIVAGVIAILMAMIIGYSLIQKKNPISVIAPTPTPTAAPTPTPTIDPKEQAYFAALPQSMLYYSFAQTSNSKNVFQADITDTRRRAVNIGYPGNYTFVTSPDGRWLLRYDEHQLERSQSDRPSDFKVIYKFPKDTLRATSVAFSADSSHIAIALTQNSRSGAGGAYYTNIVTILANQQKIGDPKEVINTDKPFRYRIVGYPQNNNIWYLEDREGQVSNLNTLSTDSGESGSPLTRFNQNGLLDRIQFDQWMNNAFSQTDTSLVRYNLKTGAEQILYQLDTSCPHNQEPNNSKISGFSAAPLSGKVLVTLNLQECKGSRRDPGATPVPPQKTLLLQASDGKVLQQQNNLPLTTINQAAWSPDNSAIWVTVDTTAHYAVDSNTLAVHAVPSLDRQTLTKEKLYFVGWLTPFSKP